MNRRFIPLIGATLVGLGLLGLTTTQLFAQTPTPNPAPPNHEQMHQMMDTAHGPGTSERMHAAMAQAMGVSAEQVEQLMDQCVGMMGMMQNMQGMMGSGMSGMMGGQNNQPMPDMMRSMMG